MRFVRLAARRDPASEPASALEGDDGAPVHPAQEWPSPPRETVMGTLGLGHERYHAH